MCKIPSTRLNWSIGITSDTCDGLMCMCTNRDGWLQMARSRNRTIDARVIDQRIAVCVWYLIIEDIVGWVVLDKSWNEVRATAFRTPILDVNRRSMIIS